MSQTLALVVFGLGVLTFVAGMIMFGVADRCMGRAIRSHEETIEMIARHRASLKDQADA